MVQFNELKFDTDNSVIVDIQIPDLSYYTDVYLDSIYIDTEETFVEGKPSDNPIFQQSIEEETKSIQLTIPSTSILATPDNLLFVQVKTTGTPTSDTPCGLDNEYSVQVLFQNKFLYEKGMNFFKEFNSCCEIPKNFIDYILKLDAFKLALGAENFSFAIDMWKYLVKEFTGNNTVQSKCGCGYG